jgi:spermidine/putrescine transport system ATP-binding protein
MNGEAPATAGGYAVELKGVSKLFSAARHAGESVAAVREIDLAIRAGEFFTLLGPSGCGKTTTLRLIAGFELPTAGQILILGHDMAEMPAHLRPVNTVFQSYALFPHLSVSDNVGFGLAVKRVPRAERRRRIAEALALVKMEGMAARRPAELSGGQQQRVALARALVNQPAVLLLDEPLGALDLKLRKEMQIELKYMQRRLGITFIFVTHDQEEALAMSDRVALMHEGRVLQVDDPVGIYERPTTRFGAGFIGEMNFLDAVVSAKANGRVAIDLHGKRLEVSCEGRTPDVGEHVSLAIRPEAMQLEALQSGSAGAADTEGWVSLPGVLREEIYIGTDRRYVVGLDSGETLVVRSQNSPASDRILPGPQTPALVRCPSTSIRVLTD